MMFWFVALLAALAIAEAHGGRDESRRRGLAFSDVALTALAPDEMSTSIIGLPGRSNAAHGVALDLKADQKHQLTNTHLLDTLLQGPISDDDPGDTGGGEGKSAVSG